MKNKNNSKPKEKEIKKTPKILGIGLIKLDFYMNLTEDLIKLYNIDLDSINSPKDLLFLCEDVFLLDLIQISSTDSLTNILLFMNKTNFTKAFVELITINTLRFKPEEEHMRKIFSHVTEHNYLFSNEMSVSNSPNKLSFAIRLGKKLIKYFDIVVDYDPFAEEINNEINKNNNQEIKEVEEKNEIDLSLELNKNNNQKTYNDLISKPNQEGKNKFL